MEQKGRLDAIVQRIVSLVDPIEIILFGSQARGEATPSSDIDLLIVMPPGTHKRHTAQYLYRELIGCNAAIDLVIATSDQLAQYGDAPGLVYKRALAEGRSLYAA